jgi:hypothetical protein
VATGVLVVMCWTGIVSVFVVIKEYWCGDSSGFLKLFVKLFSTASSDGVGDEHDDQSDDDEPYDSENTSDGSCVGKEPVVLSQPVQEWMAWE